MTYDWKDKVVLITGGGNGIGSHVVRIALEEGAKEINILDINEANAKSLQDELNAKHGVGKVKFIKCDVANHESLVAAFEAILSDKNNEYVVLNNAAILNDSLKTYRKQIDINVAAVITGSLKALDLMRKDKGGKGGAIINMSSVSALCPLPFTPIYNATKSAVMQFSVCLGADNYYSRTGVRVLTMCFGATDTSLIAIENMGSFDEVVEIRLCEPLKLYPGQKIESAARAVIDAYKQGSSGSIWLSYANKAAEDITQVDTEAYKLLTATVLKMESAAKGLVEAYEHAKSGETWIITKNKPAKNITDTVKKAYELLSDHVFN